MERLEDSLLFRPKTKTYLIQRMRIILLRNIYKDTLQLLKSHLMILFLPTSPRFFPLGLCCGVLSRAIVLTTITTKLVVVIIIEMCTESIYLFNINTKVVVCCFLFPFVQRRQIQSIDSIARQRETKEGKDIPSNSFFFFHIFDFVLFNYKDKH